MMYPINLPLPAPACCWVGLPLRLSKHRLSNSRSQRQSNFQAELSTPTREDFKISKRKRARSLSEYIPIYQCSLQCDVCMPNHVVTRSITKRRPCPLEKLSPPLKKCLGHIVLHKHCFRTCYRCKIWVSLRKVFVPPGV